MSQREEPLMQLCTTPLHGVGSVLTAADDLFVVRMRESRPEGQRDVQFEARRAASCFLVPEPGDRVWLAGDLEHGMFVTAVLERGTSAVASSAAAAAAVVAAGATATPEPAFARVRLPAHSVLEADGVLALRADALQLAARSRLTVQADVAALSARKLTGVGQEATWSFGRIKIIGDLIESFAERCIQFARWSQRTVDGIDQVRARQIDYRAEQTMQLQAENLVANASKLVKADGDQIHIG